MFKHQAELPKLPIPDLDATLDRYVQTVAPLLTPGELAATRAAADEFRREEGPRLQSALQEYAQGRVSYIEDYWYDSYLKSTGSVVLNVNPFFILEDDPTPIPASARQVARAASLVTSMVSFYTQVRGETLEPDSWRGRPMCMHQYRTLFACTRVPSPESGAAGGGDEIVRYEGTRHIVVLAEGLAYYLDVLDADGALCLSEHELAERFRRVLSDAASARAAGGAGEGASASVCVLTSETRPRWAALRADLARTPKNAAMLRVMDSALFVLCLDGAAAADGDAAARAFLHGSYSLDPSQTEQVGSLRNRWYDKLQVIVLADGVAGINFEHSRVDGHTVQRLVSDVFADTIMRFAARITTGGAADGATHPGGLRRLASTEPRRLDWDLSPSATSRFHRSIRVAEVRLADLVCQHDTRALEVTSFGKRAVVACDVSPDAFVQLGIMAAYYELYDQVVSVYEPVQTKTFRHGRTEAARTMTAEAARWCRVWASDVSADAKDAALRAAVRSVVRVVKRAATGEGVDRHLYALYCTWKSRAAPDKAGAEPPSLFRDKGWAALNHTVLSTSNCGNPALRLFGFGPVVADGFGIGYIIKDDSLSFCVASKHRQTQRFLRTLAGTLEAMLEVLRASAKRRRLESPGAGGPYGTYGFFCNSCADEDGVLEASRQASADANGVDARELPGTAIA